MHLSAQLLLSLFCGFLCDFATADQTRVSQWLENYELTPYIQQVLDSGSCSSLVICVHHWSRAGAQFCSSESVLPSNVKHVLHEAAVVTKQNLILEKWLILNGVKELKEVLLSVGIVKFDSLRQISVSSQNLLEAQLSSYKFNKWTSAIDNLPSTDEQFEELKSKLWKDILLQDEKQWTLAGIVCCCVVAVLVLGAVTSSLFLAPAMHDHSNSSAPKLRFLSFLTGRYLCPNKSEIKFNWTEPQTVGINTSFTVHFFQKSGMPYPICNDDNLLIEIAHAHTKIACSIELGGTEPNEANQAKVHFTVRRSGEYLISVLVNMVHIKDSPFTKTFLPGPPDPTKTSFIQHKSSIVCCKGRPCSILVEPKDKFGNLCIIDDNSDFSDQFTSEVVKVASGNNNAEYPGYWQNHSKLNSIALRLLFENVGCYSASVFYEKKKIQNGDCNIIVLTEEESAEVLKNILKKDCSYSGNLISINGVPDSKLKKVCCTISPKQLAIKQSLLFDWFQRFQRHLITFRLCPSTKFRFTYREWQDKTTEPILVIDDGSNSEVQITSEHANVIAATFTQFLLNNIGGSETFKDKQDFFYDEVRKFHRKNNYTRDKLHVTIDRENLLQCSFKATKNFKTRDWCKNFEIYFNGEEGIDWGGVKREWFELICTTLFDPQYNLFHTFDNNKQGLVHPLPSYKRPNDKKLKYYEFAGKIVGKCLYETAFGDHYRQLVKAKFSRSFLAQIIGLRVDFKYFEHDDPDLYVQKIKYILDNNVEDMGLTFVDEEYSLDGKLLCELELINGGKNIPVTEKNKHMYLDALAQHRLSKCVKDEIEFFLKGLNAIIPDNLLCIFDENELELLMCGTGHYSIADLRANHALSGSMYEFNKVLNWFWTVVSNFTEEEMARLLQFTTGCSQLPAGGFAELSPKFHISTASGFNILPTAHTCFNQICLPDYDSYDQFEKALRLAITEGSEGFGLV